MDPGMSCPGYKNRVGLNVFLVVHYVQLHFNSNMFVLNLLCLSVDGVGRSFNSRLGDAFSIYLIWNFYKLQLTVSSIETKKKTLINNVLMLLCIYLRALY